MEYKEALNICLELLEHLKNGALMAYKHNVESLYKEVLNKKIRTCNCKDKYADAVIEIYSYLKNNKKMKDKCTAQLLNGVVFPHNGEYYSNANLTDDIARIYLKKFPSRSNLFAVLPPEKEEKPKTAPKPKASNKAKPGKPKAEEQKNPNQESNIEIKE